jgi:hypothetical protein
MPRQASTLILLFTFPIILGMTGINHHTQLLLIGHSLANFFAGADLKPQPSSSLPPE